MALLLGGLRRHRRRRRLWFPGSRPPFPLRGSHAPARGGAYDALGRFIARERDRPFEARGPVMSTRTPLGKGPRRSRLRTAARGAVRRRQRPA
jgi:hypothetical protein